MKTHDKLFEKIVSPESLFSAWNAFKSDKKHRKDVMQFEMQLEQNIFQLHRELVNKKYKHGEYTGFYITDPKQRHIHKADVRDRVLHNAVVKVLTPVFEPTFIVDSFSCRIGKGTHKGVIRLETMARKVSNNYTGICHALKCDIRKFFDSVEHDVLLGMLSRRIRDDDMLWLLWEIIGSFISPLSNLFEHKGLPIGNLTSQLFANVYMNELDQFVKHELKIRHYARYTDDFVILARNRDYLQNLLTPMSDFLKEHLFLELHPKKISLRTLHQGIDFLGYVILPHHKLVRTKNRNRVIKGLNRRIQEYRQGRISRDSLEQSFSSYLGVLTHANTHDLGNYLKNQFWLWVGPMDDKI